MPAWDHCFHRCFVVWVTWGDLDGVLELLIDRLLSMATHLVIALVSLDVGILLTNPGLLQSTSVA